MKLKQRLFAVLLAVALVAAYLPQTAFADSYDAFSSELEVSRVGNYQQKVPLNSSVTLQVKATVKDGSESGLTYQWYTEEQNADGYSDRVDIAGATESSYTVSSVTEVKEYFCEVVNTSDDLSVVTSYKVGPDSGLYAFRANANSYMNKVAVGGDITLKVIAGETEGTGVNITYQWALTEYDESGWYLRTEVLGAETGDTYTLENVTSRTDVTCTVTDEYGWTERLDYCVWPDSGLSVESINDEASCVVAYGAGVTLGVNATVTDGSEDKLQYSWYKTTYDNSGHSLGFDRIEGATGNRLEVTGVTGYTSYECIVTDQYGYGTSMSYDVHPDTGFTAERVGSYMQKVSPGGQVTLQVKASVTDNSQLTYKWTKSVHGEWSPKDIEGATGSSYTVENVTQYEYYYCTVTDQYGYNMAFQYSVIPDSGLSVINESGYEQVVEKGGSATMSVSATVTDGSLDKLSYQWYKEIDVGGNSWYRAVIPSATGSRYEAKNITKYQNYVCEVTDQYGASQSTSFVVRPDSGLNVTAVGDETDIKVAVGGSANLGVAATVTDGSEAKLTYEWYFYDSKDYSYKKIEGAAGNTYTVENVTKCVEIYCDVKDQYDYTIRKWFTVHPDSGFMAVADNGERTVAVNTKETLHVNASVTDGSQEKITYQWYRQYRDGNSSYWDEISGATGSSYTTESITEKSYYFCTVTDQYGYSIYVDFIIDVGAAAAAPSGGSNVVLPVVSSATNTATTDTAATDTTAPAATTAAGTTTDTATKTNSAGKEVTVTTTTTTDEAGNVTGTTEKTEIANAAKNTQATVTVQKSADGKVTSATAAVTKTATEDGKANKLTVSAAVISQITEAAGSSDVDITLKAVDSSNKTKFTVKVNAKNLKAGKKLYAYVLDTKTGEYTMVNDETYTVSEKGNVSISMTKKATYELVNATDAKKIEKQITATVKAAKTKATVKTGKTTKLALSKKLNMDNVKSVTYSTSKKSVATISKSGKVTAKGKGTVTVKAKVTLKNGKTKTVKMKVTVK